MILYIGLIVALFGISVGFSFIKNKVIKILIPLIVIVVLLTIFCGLKADRIGIDTIQYRKMFVDFQQLSWGDVFKKQNVENGYILFCKLIAIVTSNFTVFNIVFYFVVWASLAFFCFAFSKEHSSFTLSLLIVFVLRFALTAYRQTLAFSFLSIALGTFMIIKNRWVRWIPFILISLIGVSMHVTAIVFGGFIVVFILCRFFKVNIYVCLSIFILCLFANRGVYFIIASIRNTTYNPSIRADFPSTSVMAILIFLVGYLLNYSNLIKKQVDKIGLNHSERIQKNGFLRGLFKSINAILTPDKDDNRYKRDNSYSLVLTMFASCFMLFALTSPIFTRMYVYFEGAVAVVLINAVGNRKNKIAKYVGYGLVTIMSVVYFYFSMKRSGYIDWYIPYETIF